MRQECREYIRDYTVFDLETTGISTRKAAVIELSAVRVRSGEITGTFSELVNPGRPIPPAGTAIHHITDDMVAGKPCLKEVLERFLEFAGEDVLVGHNITGFDLKILDRDCRRFFGRTMENDYIDTVWMARKCFPDWKRRRLVDLAEYYGLETEGAHRALFDCIMNQKVYECMRNEPGLQN